MIKIDEKYILRGEIMIGINKAKWEFQKIHKYNSRKGSVVYLDIIEQINDIISYYKLYKVFDNEIEIIYLDSKDIDDSVLNMLLNLIKKETYTLGLRFIKDPNNNFLYVYIDKVYNKNIYYVDDRKAEICVKKALGSKRYK